jgi:hypothetical protein
MRQNWEEFRALVVESASSEKVALRLICDFLEAATLGLELRKLQMLMLT